MTHFVDEANIEVTADYVERLMSDRTAGTFHFEPLSEYAQGFTTDAMVGRFAELLDKVT
jgi:hypothetical protein